MFLFFIRLFRFILMCGLGFRGAWHKKVSIGSGALRWSPISWTIYSVALDLRVPQENRYEADTLWISRKDMFSDKYEKNIEFIIKK